MEVAAAAAARRCRVYGYAPLGTQREPVEYSGGSPHVEGCVGHVHFMILVSILFALGSQRKPSFQWNMCFHVSSPLIGPRL